MRIIMHAEALGNTSQKDFRNQETIFLKRHIEMLLKGMQWHQKMYRVRGEREDVGTKGAMNRQENEEKCIEGKKGIS